MQLRYKIILPNQWSCIMMLSSVNSCVCVHAYVYVCMHTCSIGKTSRVVWLSLLKKKKKRNAQLESVGGTMVVSTTSKPHSQDVLKRRKEHGSQLQELVRSNRNLLPQPSSWFYIVTVAGLLLTGCDVSLLRRPALIWDSSATYSTQPCNATASAQQT